VSVELLAALDRKLLAELHHLRCELHAHPELSFAERNTATRLEKFLRSHGIAILARGVAGHGLVALIKGQKDGPCVALRADMDALPIMEENRLAYRSRTPGVMHACGHDGHMAAVAGAGLVLARLRHLWAGKIKLIFQPAEEEGNGARLMVEAGVLESPRPRAILGLHARPELRVGKVQVCSFPAAATGPFTLNIKGRGAHGAYPHLGSDPIVAGAQVVTALQQIVSRRIAPFEPAVVTVGAFHAGTRGNIIPESAQLSGTLRARSDAVMKKLQHWLRTTIKGVCRGLGVQGEIIFHEGTPALHNHPGVAKVVKQAAREILGLQNVIEEEAQTMGGEDFSFYLQRPRGVPGCLLWLGVENHEPLHSPRFDFGHQALRPAVLVLAQAAWKLLKENINHEGKVP